MDKAGYLTTEFWTTLLLHVITAVVAIAAIFGKTLDGNQLQPLVPTVAMLMSAIAQAYYSHSRGEVKKAVAQASAPLIVPLSAASQKVVHKSSI